jgi:hypothetical protein
MRNRGLPGRHITDCQMRLYMSFRQAETPTVAAAKAGFSAATAYLRGPFHDSLPKTKFAADSALEETGFEPSVPRKIDDAPRLLFSRLRDSRSAGEKGDNRLWQLLALAAGARG